MTTPFQFLSVIYETANNKHYFDLISNKYVKTFTHISYQNLHTGGLNQYYYICYANASLNKTPNSFHNKIYISE